MGVHGTVLLFLTRLNGLKSRNLRVYRLFFFFFFIAQLMLPESGTLSLPPGTLCYEAVHGSLHCAQFWHSFLHCGTVLLPLASAGWKAVLFFCAILCSFFGYFLYFFRSHRIISLTLDVRSRRMGPSKLVPARQLVPWGFFCLFDGNELCKGTVFLFVLDTGKTTLNVYQLSFVCFQPVFSLSYALSLPFLIFCCQFVARDPSLPTCPGSLICHHNDRRIE